MSRYAYPSDLSNLTNFMGSADGFSEATAEAFEAKSLRDYDTIKDWLPLDLHSVLDIGCGLGGVDIEIGLHTNVSVINLMDGDGTEDKRTSFSEDTKAWFDRRVGRELVAANVRCSVRTFRPDPTLTIRADLIISLKSWGHHYPVGVYLPLVERSLRPGGRVIMDIRRKRGNGLQTMTEGGFRYLATTYETPKCERMVFCREIDV